MKRHLLLLLALLGLVGCRNAYYATYEKFGVYKRDLLKKDVSKARDEQAAAQQQFKDALTRLKELTKFEGGALEKAYNSLKGEYDGCVSRVDAVHKRVREVETVANDLFVEWEKEIREIGTPALRDASQQKLSATRQKYNELHASLKSAEQSMDPVLGKLKDYVLYLKHDLNAAAIGSLQGEAANIQAEIARLIEEMSRSIARADEFLKLAP